MTPRDLYSLDRDPTFDQLKNAYNGYLKGEKQRIEAIRNIIYGASRFNAVSTAFSKKQSQATANHTFPWEKNKRDMSVDEINNVLSGMG